MALLTCGLALLVVQSHLLDSHLIFGEWFSSSIVRISLFLLLLLALGMMVFIIVTQTDKQLKMEKERAENEAFLKYTDQLETSYNELRKIKHDYVNIMTSFKIYIDEKDMGGLQNYYYEEFSDLAKALQSEGSFIDQLQKVKLRELKSILLYKLNLAAEMGLQVQVEVNKVIENIEFPKIILCQILGILLDNAMEAALESEDKKLDFALVIQENKVNLIIENSWNYQQIALSKFFQKDFSTKGSGRGLGLATVDELVQKHHVLELDTQVTEQRFIQILTVRSI
jgi:two-component system sensor histidine kinase AgrC